MNDGKVLMGWLPSPIGGMLVLQQGFFDSFYNFVSHDTNPDNPDARRVFGGYTFNGTGYIAQGRNKLVEMFLNGSECEWLLMLDWDISYEPDDVYAILDAADENTIVSGCYVTFFGEDNALRPCWMANDGNDDYVPVMEFDSTKIVELTVCGMGFTIMHRKALEKIAAAQPEDELWKWFGHDVIGDNRVGEDLTFCSRARREGIKILGHGGVMLGHTKAKTLHPQDMADPAINVQRQKKAQNVAIPPRANRRTVLSVGAGGSRVVSAHYQGYDLHTLDVDPQTNPDILADGADLSFIPDETYQAVYSAHNIEHYRCDDIPAVLAGFYRILRVGGRVEIKTPDLQEIEEHLANGKTEDDVAYEAPVGPITYGDMLHGYQKAVNDGKEYMRHHTMFDQVSLEKVLEEAGFSFIESTRGDFELCTVGIKIR